jgi:hypothetical protein
MHAVDASQSTLRPMWSFAETPDVQHSFVRSRPVQINGLHREWLHWGGLETCIPLLATQAWCRSSSLPTKKPFRTK